MSAETAKPEKRDLLSFTTILILTSFLGGMAAANLTTASQNRMLSLAITFGLVAYFGLGWAARVRRLRASRAACIDTIYRLEQRMEDHVRNHQDHVETSVPYASPTRSKAGATTGVAS